MDKGRLKKHPAMTTITTSNCFSSRVHLCKVGKKANKRAKKALSISNLRNMKQCTNYLTAHRSNKQRNKLLMLKY